MDSYGSRFLAEIPPGLFGREEPRREVPSWLRNPPARPAYAGLAPRRPAAVAPAAPSVAASPFLARPAAVDSSSAGRRMTPESLDYFKVGTEVLHPVLGVGTIERRDGLSSNPRLTIHFRNHGPRTVFAVSAHMEILLP